ncbi:deoxyribose-phosphate aldolase [Planktosalinus lacus]|uniref:Deoxyribose-phosphate aldolase n=1 Tax=Planktosalinus lacus TaxID=1526573 RepID=A0A8J2V6Q2_9FLAO|nr:deoxyribose-phosphate aldolase [Planktosalinus lacus]GGD83777.1 deoxyribose-phosphate aldolase 1 [Planktosalinus lacus]
MQNLNKYIDHTLLKATATEEDIKKLCKEAIEYDFFSICVNSSYIAFAKAQLSKSNVKVCSVVGFPLGAMSANAKAYEAKKAIEDGADEIDMVLNIGFLKSENFDAVWKEIEDVKKTIGNKVLKVILETCYLEKTEIIKASELAMLSGADFIKTSTGFGTGGATIEDVQLMKSVVKNQVKIKASGGIKDKFTALEYIALGVDRIGTSSGIAIVTNKNSENEHTY